MIKGVAILLPLLVGFAGEIRAEFATSKHFEVIWTVPTNHLPPKVWIYKIVPEEFSPAVISNLIALGSFAPEDRTNIPGQPPRSVYFTSKDATRRLGVVPTCGWVFYYDSNAEAKGHEMPVGVPDEREAYQLGTHCLQKLGIDPSQLATVGESTELRIAKTAGSRNWHDKALGTNVEQTYMRGVSFIRRVDGIDFDGIAHGGGSMWSLATTGKSRDWRCCGKGWSHLSFATP